MTDKFEEARKSRLAKEKAEAEAARAEARFHNMQADRLAFLKEEDESQLAAQRVFDFTSEVTYGKVRDAMNTMWAWHAHRPGEPMTLRLMTPGGDVLAGLALFDSIRLIEEAGTPVTTLGVGMVASMGAILLQAGGTRQTTPNTYLMVHEISSVGVGRLSEILDEAKFSAKVQDRLLDILCERATISRTLVKRRWARKDWWLDASAAIEAGFVDEIVGDVTFE